MKSTIFFAKNIKDEKKYSLYKKLNMFLIVVKCRLYKSSS